MNPMITHALLRVRRPAFACLCLAAFLILTPVTASTIPATDARTAAAHAVLARLLGERARSFDLEILPRDGGLDAYEVEVVGGRVRIKGTDAVTVCRAAYDYLRTTCHVEVSWSGTHCELPSRFPDFPKTRVVCPNQHRQIFNVCTFGYTTVWWDWPRWERELDWMALHGINMPLAMVGEEAIWQRIWRSEGITDKELSGYFTGPAFLPWHRMGNVNGHAGPLPQHWIDAQESLQKQILNRMRELGMDPVVPAFSGFVPAAFQRLHPEAHIEKLSDWGGFPEEDRTHLLFPTSPLFHEIGVKFIREYRKTFGPVRYYLADSFNEMEVPVTREGRYDELASFGKAVFSPIADADPNGVWVMQGWLFYNDAGFWDSASVKALLRDVPDDRMIILDLANEAFHGWKVQHGFYGKEWIYSMIHNFGGNNPLNGNLPIIAKDPPESLTSPLAGHRVGMGLAPEGIENNDVVYELSTDMMWRSDTVNLNSWLSEYAHERYGSCPPAMARAWGELAASAYSKGAGNIRHAFQERPHRGVAGNVDVSPVFHQALRDFLSCSGALKGERLFVEDAVELAVQWLGGIADQRLQDAVKAHDSGMPELRDSLFADGVAIMEDIDALLNTRSDRRLERWVENARHWGASPQEKAYYEWNAKLQVTLWGGPDLYDYASKLWSGLIRDFYAGRWKKYFSVLRTLPPGKEVPSDSLVAWEEAWTRRSGVSKAAPVRDPLEAVHATLQRWSRAFPISPQPDILPATPVFDAGKGIDVTLECTEPHGTIHYTLDGTLPTAQSPVYREPIHLVAGTNVIARTFVKDKHPSFVAQRQFTPIDPERNGLIRRYFEGEWRQLPDFDTVRVKTQSIAYDCTLDDVQHRPDFFGLRYTGYLKIDEPGDYVFIIGSDDGSRLCVDSAVVVDNDGLHSYVEKQGTIHLDSGLHMIRLDFFEYNGGERLQVQMEGPGIPRGPLPPSSLFINNQH